MTDLTPFDVLFRAPIGQDVPLPEPLDRLCGTFSLPIAEARPYVISNFVTTLDGVVSLKALGQSGGGEISGYNRHDRLLMGLLRAVADAVVVGSGTLRAVPRHLWAAESIFPALAAPYQQLRCQLGKTAKPLNVIVSGRGTLDLGLPVFQTPDISTLIVTTKAGERQIGQQAVSPSVRIVGVEADRVVSAADVLTAIESAIGRGVVLIEGGPRLLGDFVAERLLDELFLTLAPQIAGRDKDVARPGMVEGHLFAPTDPRWSKLIEVRRANDHLFLRYQFSRERQTNPRRFQQ